MSLTGTDWRITSGITQDRLAALDSLESLDDFSGRAAIYDSVSATKPLPVDLIVQNIEFGIDEHIQYSQMIGNGFVYMPFGKGAMTVRVTATLPDTGTNYGKSSFMDIYRNYLRMEAVARRGTAPIFVFPNAALVCGATGVNMADTSQVEDCVALTLQLVVMAAIFSSNENSICFDYLHGTELSEDSVLSSATPTEAVAANAQDVGIAKTSTKNADENTTLNQ